MASKCFVCEKKIKYGEDYTSVNKGTYSEVGDKDWIALIFHDECWARLGQRANKKIAPLFEVEA